MMSHQNPGMPAWAWLVGVFLPVMFFVAVFFHPLLLPPLRGLLSRLSRIQLPTRSPLLAFMRQARKNLCYCDIRMIETDLYGRAFEHGGDPGKTQFDIDRSRYRMAEWRATKEWYREFRLPREDSQP